MSSSRGTTVIPSMRVRGGPLGPRGGGGGIEVALGERELEDGALGRAFLPQPEDLHLQGAVGVGPGQEEPEVVLVAHLRPIEGQDDVPRLEPVPLRRGAGHHHLHQRPPDLLQPEVAGRVVVQVHRLDGQRIATDSDSRLNRLILFLPPSSLSSASVLPSISRQGIYLLLIFLGGGRFFPIGPSTAATLFGCTTVG